MKKYFCAWTAMVLLAVASIWSASQCRLYTTTAYKCSRCRMVKSVRTVLGTRLVRIEQTDYSRWYARTESRHEHIWCWCGGHDDDYLFAVGHGCGQQHRIWEIPDGWQRKFVESASSAELEKFYSYLDSPDAKVQRQAVDMVWTKQAEENQPINQGRRGSRPSRSSTSPVS